MYSLRRSVRMLIAAECRQTCGVNKGVMRSELCSSMASEPPHIGGEFPSDQEELRREQHNKRSQTRQTFRPQVDPKTTSIILFPGQGAQFVGMGKRLLQNQEATNLFTQASEILKYDLLKLCLDGPLEALSRTEVCQLATLVTSVAALQLLKESNPEVLDSCVGTAGFSVGEYAALVFSGALAFEDAVHLVQARALAMQSASDEVASGMMTVFLSPKSKLNYAMLCAREYCKQRLDIEDPVCSIANYLFTEAKVIGGHTEALEFVRLNAKEFQLKRCKMVDVSGAFHTKLMKPAAKSFEETIRKVSIERPIIPVYSNVTCTAHRSPKLIQNSLIDQIHKPLRWEQILHSLYQREQGTEFPSTYEVGPGNQLSVMLKMVNRKAYNSCHQIDV